MNYKIKKLALTFIVFNFLLIQSVMADMLFYYNSAILSSIIHTKQVNAIDKIEAYAASGGTESIPTLQDYINAGVIGVTESNLVEINELVGNLTPEDVNTVEEIQDIADVWIAEYVYTYTFENNEPQGIIVAQIYTEAILNTSNIIAENAVPSITTVTVDLNITGGDGYMGEYTISLTSPSGTTVDLTVGIKNNWIASSYNIVTFDDNANESITSVSIDGELSGSYRPENLLSFEDENANGTWTLSITDVYFGGGNTLNSWSITVE